MVEWKASISALAGEMQSLSREMDMSQLECTAFNTHEAYRRVRLDQTAYGRSMIGPLATADVEATPVTALKESVL